MGFTSLNHHIDLHGLHEAYLRTRKGGAVGKPSAISYQLSAGDILLIDNS